MTSDPAHVLFPSDTPASARTPEWFKANRNAATARLMGSEKPAADDTAARMFPGEMVKAAGAAKSAGPVDLTKPDAAAILFKDAIAASFDAKPVTEISDGFANAAISDNDGGERYRAIEAARDDLIADAKAKGTDAADLADALAVVKERQGDSLFEPTPEQAEQHMTEALDACRAEGITDADINLARRFVADLETAPGTLDSLERTGSGNDIRLIRSAIKEARRRGYR